MNILDQETMLSLFHTYYPFFVGGLFIGAFALTFYIIPKVLWVSNEKNLMAPVNNRSAHVRETPSFGGVAFFITLILMLCILQSLRLNYVGNHLIGAITILFMVGLKDDLVISTARVKFFGQIAAVCFLIFSPELHLSNLHGFWGIYEIPAFLGFIINALIAVALINAYNLIDGIDGLASMVGIVIAAVFGVVFYETGNAYFVLICAGLIGILLAFLRFNFSRGRRKIFMGDSGSLVVGLVLSFLTMKILVMENTPQLIEQGYLPANRLLLIASVLFIPAFDTLRVMILRILDKKSPFTADRNHAHHILLDLGLSHFRASLTLVMLNLLVIIAFTFLSNKLNNLWLTLLVVSLYASTFMLFTRLKVLTDREARPTHAGPLAVEKNVKARTRTRELEMERAG